MRWKKEQQQYDGRRGILGLKGCPGWWITKEEAEEISGEAWWNLPRCQGIQHDQPKIAEKFSWMYCCQSAEETIRHEESQSSGPVDKPIWMYYNGSMYLGDWKPVGPNDAPVEHGLGILYHFCHKIRGQMYVGEWKDGYYDGQGEIFWLESSQIWQKNHHPGSTIGDLDTCLGIPFEYKGRFIKAMMHDDRAVVTLKNGTAREGQWIKGIKVGKWLDHTLVVKPQPKNSDRQQDNKVLKEERKGLNESVELLQKELAKQKEVTQQQQQDGNTSMPASRKAPSAKKTKQKSKGSKKDPFKNGRDTQNIEVILSTGQMGESIQPARNAADEKNKPTTGARQSTSKSSGEQTSSTNARVKSSKPKDDQELPPGSSTDQSSGEEPSQPKKNAADGRGKPSEARQSTSKSCVEYAAEPVTPKQTDDQKLLPLSFLDQGLGEDSYQPMRIAAGDGSNKPNGTSRSTSKLQAGQAVFSAGMKVYVPSGGILSARRNDPEFPFDEPPEMVTISDSDASDSVISHVASVEQAISVKHDGVVELASKQAEDQGIIDLDISDEQTRKQKISKYLSNDVIGSNPSPATMAYYAFHLYEMGFESVEMIQTYLKSEHIRSFHWMVKLHKDILIQKFGNESKE